LRVRFTAIAICQPRSEEKNEDSMVAAVQVAIGILQLSHSDGTEEYRIFMGLILVVLRRKRDTAYWQCPISYLSPFGLSFFGYLIF
jgi:hypothetical protein